ncbi:MAG: L-seryl-tRNA(Sec) selenium transferase [Actinobacteria bacterium]|nr:L-seryl-tRNA(Sec) selenium transferase [Actinomycetota bacterium]
MTDEGRLRALRALPAVDRLAARLANGVLPTPAEAVSVARAVLAERRGELLAGAPDDDDADLLARARERLHPGPRRVLNGTGVVIHTNLGRAPLAVTAARAVHEAAQGYADLELDLDDGRRGHRDQHVRELLRELTGAQDGLAVNNAAGAALLAVAALAARQREDRPVIVSRGQLVEIGGGFRVPEVIAQAGARLVEVGTTNRTRLADYERALADERAAGAEPVLLRVHQSNFRTVGFVEQVDVEALCGLGAPVIDDVGSGVLTELPALADEPPVRRSVAAGAALTVFSGDKLLGGPQAGILVGRAEAVEACRRHPLARALRIGRLPLAALAATLALHRDPDRARRAIPVLAMLDVPRKTLEQRARRLADACGGEVVEAVARVGGGALPLLELSGPAVALDPPARAADPDPAHLAAALRAGRPPLIPRLHAGRVLVDPRTLADDEIGHAATAIRAALAHLATNL